MRVRLRAIDLASALFPLEHGCVGLDALRRRRDNDLRSRCNVVVYASESHACAKSSFERRAHLRPEIIEDAFDPVL